MAIIYIKGKLQYHPNKCPFFNIIQWLTILFYVLLLYNTSYYVDYYLMRKLCTILQYHPCLLPFIVISSIFRLTRLPSSSSTALVVLCDVRCNKMNESRHIVMYNFIINVVFTSSTLHCVLHNCTYRNAFDGGHNFDKG